MEANRWAQFVALDGATKVRTAKALFGYDESAGNVEEYICSIHGHEPTDEEVEEWGELDEFGSILSFFRKKLIRIGVKHGLSVPLVVQNAVSDCHLQMSLFRQSVRKEKKKHLPRRCLWLAWGDK